MSRIKRIIAFCLTALLAAALLCPASFAHTVEEGKTTPTKYAENIKRLGWQIYAVPGTTQKEILDFCGEYSHFERYFEGKELPSLPDTVFTGMRVKIFGEGVCEIVVMGDPDCDGAITSADARYALRLSVNLEQTYNVYRLAACAVDNIWGDVSSAQARLILRGSVGLEDPVAWFRAVDLDD